jgi:hypothetical protein
VAGAFDGSSDFTLMLGASSRLAARTNFSVLYDKAPQHIGVFVINDNVFIGAELADFGPRKKAAFSTTLPRFVIAKITHGRLTPVSENLEGEFVFVGR